MLTEPRERRTPTAAANARGNSHNYKQCRSEQLGPWTPQRSPGFMRRLTRHKLTLVKLLGGKVAT